MGVDREFWMKQAIDLARQAAREGEVPVGAVLVRDEKIVGRGTNRSITDSDPTAHAEIVALRDAASRLANHRLPGSELYVTIEPCTMCAGALVHARVSGLFFGAREPRAGSVVSTQCLLQNKALNHHVEVVEGICQEECSALMTDFFRGRRS
jgi:tRNA(adenine34) deaminase